jgi:biotin synthase
MKELIQSIRGGKHLSYEQALDVARNATPAELYEWADQLRREFHHDRLDLCSIANAKSGKCSEDCKFCAQSSHYLTDVDSYETIPVAEALRLAGESDEAGVGRFSLVTAGKSVTLEQIDRFGKIYKALAESTGMRFCASMGMLTLEKAERLKSYGVTRYHCNLETCRSFFPEVCTTHTWDEKVDSIKAAQAAGLEVCSGGIIGLGETLEHRLQLAFELRELGILSIPINILTPIANTPFEKVKPLSIPEILQCVAMFRLINPQAVIRLAGGRSTLGDQQELCFTSGANGAIVGNYLTTSGNNLADDLEMFAKLGFSVPDKKRGNR